MKSPDRPTSHFRSLSTRSTRLAWIIGAVAIAATVLFSSSSLAGTIGQNLLSRAAAVIGGQSATQANAAPASHAVTLAEAVPSESSTMLVERSHHSATRLADGRVLIAGGENASGALNQSEIYDPVSATFSAAANMNAQRADHSATLLADGRVLIAGGRSGGVLSGTTEIFDPTTGVFSNGPSLSVARAGHSATLFADGRVFVAGGDAAGSAEILDVAAGTSAAAGTMNSPRSGHSAALLQDGRVLLVGGRDAGGNNLNSGEIFDGAFSSVGNALVVARVRAHLRVLFDGKVQIIGGSNDGSMEIYDPSIAAFGAYAHVVPESDPCVGLHSHVLASQVRAALFHNGQADPLLDRSGHTITEFGGSALVLGGTNSSGAFLNSAAVNSSATEITTDKLDYSPGETALISGRGFQPGETVRVKIHEDPHTPQERGFDAVADGNGNFSGEYLVMDYDLDMKFIVGARGLTSGRTAQTTFTDSNPQSVTVAAPTSVTVTQGSTAVYGNVTVVKGGNNNACSITLSAIAGAGTGLPAGAAAVFGTNPLVMTTADVSTSLSVTTLGSTPAGTYTFVITGANGGGGCQGPGPGNSNLLTLIVNAATVNTTTTVANANATYGASAVTLNATVTPASGPAVNSGSVTFTVKQGMTVIGTATTDTTVVSGAASVSYALPANTNAGSYTIEATYNAGAGFNGSSGTGTLTIDPRAVTITADPQSKVYGEADPALTYQITSGSLAFSDMIVGALVRAAGENVGIYAITQGTLAIDDGNGGNNYNLTFVGANFTITARPITITADPQSKVYGEADPALTYQITSGSLAFSDMIVGALVRAAGENVGIYAITQGTLAIDDGNGGNNYNLTFVGANFTITARPITITADPQSKVYGEADPALTYQITSGSLAFSDMIVGALVRAAGENVGVYAITQGTLAIDDGNGGNNYNLTFVGDNLTITQRPLQVTATAGQFKIYGDADPVFAYTITSGSLAFMDSFTGALSRVAGENVGLYAITIGTLKVNDGNGGANYNLTLVSNNFEIKKRAITVKADPKTKTFGDPDPVFTYQVTIGSLAFSDTFTGALTRDPGELVGMYAIKIGTLAINDGNGGNNYMLTFVGDNLTILTACSVFNGFQSPIGGAVEKGDGGSFNNPVRAFKLNSTIPVKFNAVCFGVPLTTGIHTLQAIKYSNATDSDPPIDATPTDAATTGNHFRLTGTEWHFNLSTKGLGNNGQGTWLLKATLFDGSSYTVWVSIKK